MSRLLSSGWIQAWLQPFLCVFITWGWTGGLRAPVFPYPAALARPGVPEAPFSAFLLLLSRCSIVGPSGKALPTAIRLPSMVRPSYGHTCE